MNRLSKTKKRKAFISIALVLALAITGAVAFMTARDSAENKFTVGNVDIDLTEPRWDENNAKDIVSGQIIEKDPTIENKGKNDAYVYMMVEIPKDTVTADEFYPLFSFTANEGWTLVDSKLNAADDAYDYYLYAHSESLAPGDKATLFNEVKFANVTSDFVDIYAQNGVSSFDINVTGYAIQSDFYNSEANNAETAWVLYKNQNDWNWPVHPVPNYVTYLSASASPISRYIYRDYNGKDETTEFEINVTPTVEESDEFLGWVGSNGIIYQNGDTVTAEELYVYDYRDPTKLLNINPTMTELVKTKSTAVDDPNKVMLIPKNDTCTTVIDRNGGTVDDYTADSEWYVYGLEEYLTEDTLLNKYIDVQGDGRIEIISVDVNFGPYRGTGTTINVYNRNGSAEDTSDDTLVESFKIVIFGDINGDAIIRSADATMVRNEDAGVTTWHIKGSDDYSPEKIKAADLNNDKCINCVDATLIHRYVSGVETIDQVTGTIKSH